MVDPKPNNGAGGTAGNNGSPATGAGSATGSAPGSGGIDLQALIAATRSVTSLANGPTGVVTAGTGAGGAETALLSAWACRKAAKRIAKAVEIGASKRPVVIVAGTELPSFASYEAFEMQVRGLNELAKSAGEAAAAAARDGAPEVPLRDAVAPPEAPLRDAAAIPPLAPLAPIAVVGALLDVAAKIATYFQSDYTLTGATVTADDQQLLVALAAQLGNGKATLLQKIITPLSGLVPLLYELDQNVKELGRQAASLKSHADALRASASTEADPARKVSLCASATAFERPLKSCDDVATKYEDLIGRLAAADGDGKPFGAKVLQGWAAYNAIWKNEGLILNVSVRAAEGGSFAKKNIWTFLGGMPFYAMGGAICTYALTDPKTGAVLASGLEVVSSGYVKLSAIERKLGENL